MTTRIHDPEQGSYLPTYVDLTATGNTVTVRASNGLMGGTAKVDRAEFLAAVANELDVVVTPRADLPKIEDDGSGDVIVIPGDRPASVLPSTPGATEYRRRAHIALAIAEHLDKNPPIDEAQVNALARLVAAETNGTHIAATALARRLIQAGVRMDGAK